MSKSNRMGDYMVIDKRRGTFLFFLRIIGDRGVIEFDEWKIWDESGERYAGSIGKRHVKPADLLDMEGGKEILRLL